MPTEIERKFLVTNSDWYSEHPTLYRQGYLSRDKERTVRVRIAGDKGLLTVKGISIGASRQEFEYEIPLDDARSMIKLCIGPLVEKRRHLVQFDGLTWEIDEFLGDNAGLVVAEVELESEDQQIETPDWVGLEVTNDTRYFNSNLSKVPYSTWAQRS